MSSKNYDVLSNDEILVEVLDLAKMGDADSFKKIIVDLVIKRPDFGVLEVSIMDTLLEKDCLKVYQNTFEDRYFIQWCKQNVSHVVRHCPKTFAYWSSGKVGGGLGACLAVVSRELSTMPFNERLRVLEGDFSNAFAGYPNSHAHQFMHLQLERDAGAWRHLSPSWLATAELQDAATSLGWRDTYVPAMVQRNIWEHGAEHWLPNIKYPYSLMACEVHRYVTEFGELASTFPDIIACSVTGSAVDIALAKYILSLVPQGRDIYFHLPSTFEPIGKDMATRIEGFVQAHIAMTTLEDMALKLVRGASDLFQDAEMFSLPDSLGLG